MQKYRLGLYGILRSWEGYVKEWLTFHSLVGFDRFYIAIDDEDELVYQAIKELPFAENIIIHKCTGQKIWTRQIDAYRFFFDKYSEECQWIAIVDGDEFVFSPTGKDLASVLDQYENIECGGVYLPMRIFGNCGHTIRPKGLIIDEYVLSTPKDPDRAGFKTITKTSDITGMCHCHQWKTRRPYISPDNVFPIQVANSEINHGHYDTLCVNHYQTLSMEDWVQRSRDFHNGGFHGFNATEDFFSRGGDHTNRDISIYSKRLRGELGKKYCDATYDNTLFLSYCDYRHPEEISEMMKKTALKNEIEIQWSSYGDVFHSFLETKVYKTIKALTKFKKQGKRYAFLLDARDVVFNAPAYDIIDEFNLIYNGGVMYNADSPGVLFPFGNENMMWRISSSHGYDGIINAGLYCGSIDDILETLYNISNIKQQYVNQNYQEHCTQVMSYNIKSDGYDLKYGHIPTDDGDVKKNSIFEDDQFLLHTAQCDAKYNIYADKYKQLLALVAGDDIPDISQLEKLPYHSTQAVGTAKILHLPHLSRNIAKYAAWVQRNILT